jgi:hypothetical protein
VAVASSVALFTLLFASFSAYTVARLRLAWMKAMLSLSVAARLVPLIVLMVPLYVLFRRYGLLNSLTGVVVAEIGWRSSGQTVAAFRERRALVAAQEARKAVAVCLAVEQALREDREVSLALHDAPGGVTVRPDRESSRSRSATR